MDKEELSKVTSIITDFDGVLTDNFVYSGSDGEEYVRCSRSDGLAFSVLRQRGIEVFILSTETNEVVARRAEKLKVYVYQGIGDKKEKLLQIVDEFDVDLSKCIYIGNDINDLQALKMCRYKACPSDSHINVVIECNIQLTSKGGFGAIRELVEEKMGLMDDIYNS